MVLKLNQFFQNDGRKRIKTVNNSNLPNNIPTIKNHLATFDMYAKFSVGPIVSPRPGPTFDKDVAAPDIDVIKSKPVKDKSKDNKRNKPM